MGNRAGSTPVARTIDPDEEGSAGRKKAVRGEQMEDKKIKIYISCHKPCAQVKNDIFTPVMQRDVVEFLRKGTDEDRFMAERANEYCELLTQYWAWKYEDADYYGFGHYRRYFEFNDSVKSNAYCMVKRDYLDGAAVRELGLSDESRIRAEAEKYDVITPVPFNYYVKSVYWQYKSSGTLHIEDLDTVLEIIREEFPQYLKAAKKYLFGHYMYACNMFVMKRELFLEYSEWLFSVLRKFYERRDMAALGYSNEAMRTPGHLGERLFGVFCAYLSERGGIRFGRRRTVQFENTEPEEEYYPAFGGKGTAVFMPVRAERVCLAAATLSSLAGAAEENYCDVIALCDGVKAEDKDKLRAVTAGKSNISLRFFDAARLLSGQGVASLKGDARTAYMQLSLADAFPHYDRALWLDDGCIVLADISPLYAADLGGALCGGVRDCARCGSVNGFSSRIRDYYPALGLTDPRAFVQAGVLAMDLAAMRAELPEELLCVPFFAGLRDARCDAVNRAWRDKIAYLPAEWNCVPEEEGSDGAAARAFAPKEIFLSAQAALRSPKLLHFCGSEQPWKDPASAHAPVFWAALRGTPFWEEALAANKKGKEKRGGNVVLRWISLKLFPYGSRRRSAVKRLFGKKK